MANLIPLSELPASDLQRIAELHCEVMPTLLTDLGYPVVQRYYEAAGRDAQAIGFAALAPVTNEALGWVMGSPHPTELVKRLRQAPLWFVGQVIRAAGKHPGILMQLLRTALAPADANLIRSGEIELTYIGVAVYARGQNLGDTLVRRFLAASSVEGYTRVSLSVEEDNAAAIHLYKKFGFETVKEFREGKFRRLRMSVKLS